MGKTFGFALGFTVSQLGALGNSVSELVAVPAFGRRKLRTILDAMVGGRETDVDAETTIESHCCMCNNLLVEMLSQ